MPQTRRKTLKRVKMGKGYRWSYGGKLIPTKKGAAMAKRRRAAAAAKPSSNPKRKRKTASKTSTRYVRATTKPATRRVRKNAPKRKTFRVAAAANPRRKKTSTATRKKISAALKRYHRTKRVSDNPPRKRRKAVAKKTTRRKTTRRRTTSTRKPRYGTKAYYRWLGKRGAAARKRRGTKKATSRRRVRRNPPRPTKVSTRYSKRRIKLPRKRGGKLVSHRIKRTGYRSAKRGQHSYRYRIVKRNPGLKDIGGLFGKILPIYGGFIIARIGAAAIDQYVVAKNPSISTSLGKAAPLLSPALLFLGSVFIGPKVLKGPTGGQILEGLQLGTGLQILDGIGKQFIAPSLATQPILAKAFGGYDDMGVMGLGMGAYMADPTGYSLPPAHATLEPGMGLDVHEAMALDAYVADDGLGLNVEEALADSESDYMQRGGAGGSLAKTVFTY